MRLIEKVWFNKHQARWLLIPLLLPFSGLFWLLSSLRRLSFKLGFSESVKLSKPVIVVGNIGVGGNGKTPMVIYLVALTRSMGFTPGVISRGYGGKAPEYPYRVTSSSTASEAGDEPILIYQRCNVPVTVGSDRIASAQQLIDHGCDIIISDDGLQHYRLQRDLELIIVDGKRLFGNGLLLPSGPLREGKWRLAKSDLVIYNGIDKDKNLINNSVEGLSDSEDATVTMMGMSLIATKVINLNTGENISLTEFVEMHPSVNAIAGIGSPVRFFNTLLTQNFTLIKSQGFVDHHHYSLNDFSDFSDNPPLLMTEKDAVKCQKFCKNNWWYVPVDAVFNEQEQLVVINKLKTLASGKA